MLFPPSFTTSQISSHQEREVVKEGGGKNAQVGKEVIKKSMVWILIALAGYMSSLASPLLNQPKVRRVVREDIPARAPIRIQTF